jgi:chromosome partitioning protein
VLVWAVASQKGGVGKTTTVASLSGWLEKEGLRILVIDTDPHASLTAYMGFEDDQLDSNLYDIYSDRELTREKVLACCKSTRFKGLDIIGSTMALATIDRQLSGRAGVGRILKHALSLIDSEYDVAIIDCPPVLGALMVNALVAASLVLVPTQTEFLALKGLEGMVRTFAIMQKASKGAGIDYIVVPTMYDRRTHASNTSLDFLKMHYRDHLWPDVIPVDTLFRESSYRNIPVPLMDKKSRGSEAYRKLLEYSIAHELKNNPQLVTPSVAAVLTDDSAGVQKDNHEKEIADDMSSMLGSGEEG